MVAEPILHRDESRRRKPCPIGWHGLRWKEKLRWEMMPGRGLNIGELKESHEMLNFSIGGLQSRLCPRFLLLTQ